MKKKGFTLIELLGVLVILSIVLAIAVPSITGIIANSAREAFKSDAKLVLKAIDYQKLNNEDFDVTSINITNIDTILGLSNENYDSVSVYVEEDSTDPEITIIGNGKWEGLIACGTSNTMRVVESTSDCSTDIVPPVIEIIGDNPIDFFVGEPYSDPGFKALDDREGDITNRAIVTSDINPNKPGTYRVTYSIMDMAGNETIVYRLVNVIDNEKPTISINPNGDSTYAKTRNVALTVTDMGTLSDASLKYVWTSSDSEPSVEMFTSSFTNGDTISSPFDLSGPYYLWVTASDDANNTTIIKSNIFNLDNTKPIITLNGSNSITIDKGSTYNDLGATATDNADSSVVVQATGNINPNINGTYYVVYSATDSSGNIADEVTRTINVVDIKAPVITILGSNPASINIGSTYVDAGATALDESDGNLTSSITVTSNINPSVAGSYTVTYTVFDKTGNKATAARTVNVIDNINPIVTFGTNGNSTYAKTRSTTVTVTDNTSINTSSLKYQWTTSTVQPMEVSFTSSFVNGATISTPTSFTGTVYLWIVAKDTSGNTTIARSNLFNVDNTPPVITMIGSSPITITRESAYTDAGATANDDISGNITSSIVATSNVNPNVIGTYTVTYNVSDAAGNTAASVTRTVNVVTAVPAGWTAVRTPADLYNMRNNPSGLYYIDNDITLTGSAYDTWTPISNFSGSLDGGYHKIIGLKTTNTSVNSVGLFAQITSNNVVVKNLEFTNVSLTGSNYVGAVTGNSSASGVQITNVKMSSGTVTSTSSIVGGLVGYVTGGLTISGSSASGTINSYSTYSGGLVGYVNNGSLTVSNSYSSATVIAASYYAGGLVGFVAGTPNITNSYATGNVTGGLYVGGLIGYTSGGTVSKSYASGNVTVTSYSDSSNYYGYTGGLIGMNYSTVSDCYALGNISRTNATSALGGLIGLNGANVSRVYSIGKVIGLGVNTYVGPLIGAQNGGTLTNLYWVIDTTLMYSSNVAATGINTIVAGTYKSSYGGFDFTNVWDTIEGSTTPYIKGMMLTSKNYITATQNYAREGAGTPSNPYLIKTPEDLNQIRTSLNASFKLANDITLTGTAYDVWTPISGFAGSLDGNGFKIIGLKTTNTSANSVGLFAQITSNNVVIKNLEFTNVSLTGSNYVGAVTGNSSASGVQITNVKMSSGTVTATSSIAGGLVGYVTGSLTISGSSVSGTINSYSTYVGGLVGYVNNGALNVSSSYSSATIVGASYYVGGLVGFVAGTPNITTSYATGNVTGGLYVGGLIGYTSGGSISRSYASGNVTVTSYSDSSNYYGYTGGLIGMNYSAVSDCYALGDISRTNATSALGGLIGLNGANVSQVYSTGKIIGLGVNTYVGPLIGSQNSGTLTNLYWIIDTSLMYSSNVAATGINTIVQGTYKSSYSGFDFANIWDTIEGTTTPYIRGMMLTTKNYMTATQNYARQGAGTPGDPYIIKTPEDLNQMRTSLNASFKLANDITLTGTAYDTWTPISGFAGSLDGNGFKIIGLKTTNTGSSYVGLFGSVTGSNVVIKNLTFTNVSLTGSSFVGTAVGYASGSNLQITNVTASGTVTGSTYAGGIIGHTATSATISSTVAAMNVTSTSSIVGGLVGYVTGGLTISGSSASGTINSYSTYSGGLVGYVNNGSLTVSNSYSSATVIAASYYAGGLVGFVAGTPNITNSYATGNVTGGLYVGGLIGYTSGGTVSKSYASGNVTVTSFSDSSNYYGYTGGLIGMNYSTISDCYALGNISRTNATSALGGLIGLNGSNVSRVYSIGKVIGLGVNTYVGPLIGAQNGGTLTNLYWVIDTTLMYSSNVAATGINTIVAGTYKSSYGSFDFTNVWDTIEGSTTPYIKGMMLTSKNYITATQNYARQGAGTPSDPYLIKTPEDLNQIRTSLNASFKLANDITLTGTAYDVWTPISGFAGSLDGNGFKIIGLKTTNTSANSVGLFAQITSNNVVVKNLEFANVSLTGSNYVGAVTGNSSASGVQITNVKMSSGTVTATSSIAGGLVGYVTGSLTISGSSVSGTINSYSTYVGGLVGYVNNGALNVSSSYSSATVVGASYYVGGLVGFVAGTPNIITSYATGNVTGGLYVGGLIGYTSGGSVSRSYATGSVTVTSYSDSSNYYGYTGGLIGMNYSAVSDCYAQGNISRTNATSAIGGLIGYNGSSVSRAYNTGKIIGLGVNTYVGPLIGVQNSSSTYLYWDTATTGMASSNVTATGLTTAQMYVQGNFATFDFTNIWIASGTAYPRLR